MAGVKKVKKPDKKNPVIVIGGGPAGMTAAQMAAQHFDNVILFDKNPEPGKKLQSKFSNNFIISEELSSDKIAKAFGEKEEFVKPALKAFTWKDCSAHLAKMGIKIASNGSNHLSILSEDATDINLRLRNSAEQAGVQIRKSSKVSDIIITKNRVSAVMVNSVEYPASNIVIACGSVASPIRGATEDGYEFARKAGHNIVPIKSALVGLETVEKYGKIMTGAEFRDCGIEIIWNEKIQFTDRGSVKFTSYGVEGELILTHSARIIEMLSHGRSPENKVEVHIDMMPHVSKKELDAWVVSKMEQNHKITVGNLFEEYIPLQLRNSMNKIVRIHSDKPMANLSNLERKALLLWIKDFHITISRPRPFNETMGVLGGVDTKEVDRETMRSRKVDNLYFAGEVLDLLGPWGGYNLQMAFSTGYLAGISVCKNLTTK